MQQETLIRFIIETVTVLFIAWGVTHQSSITAFENNLKNKYFGGFKNVKDKQ